MAQNNRDFAGEECRPVMKYIFLEGNLAKKFTMSIALGDKHPGLLGLGQGI
jgi:hypothetical protein